MISVSHVISVSGVIFFFLVRKWRSYTHSKYNHHSCPAESSSLTCLFLLLEPETRILLTSSIEPFLWLYSNSGANSFECKKCFNYRKILRRRKFKSYVWKSPLQEYHTQLSNPKDNWVWCVGRRERALCTGENPHWQSRLSNGYSRRRWSSEKLYLDITQVLTQSHTQEMTFQTTGKIWDEGWLFEGISFTRLGPDQTPSLSIQFRFIECLFHVKQGSRQKGRRMLNITANTNTAVHQLLQNGVLRTAQPFCMVIPNPGHIQDMEGYRLQETVMGKGTKQYLYMTTSSTFQPSFSNHISERYTNCY